MTTGSMKLGLIPGVAGESLQNDWDGTLERLKAMGYEGVEMAMGTLEKNGMTAGECRKNLERHGLEAMSLFCTWGPFATEAETHIEAAQELGCDYMVWGWSPCDDSDQMQEALPVMHKAASMVAAAGMELIYHNHDHEFKNRVDGRVAFDWMMDLFRSDLLKCELDIGWVDYGGQDVVKTIQHYANRCPILHMRDVGNPEERGTFIEVGNGTLDIPAIIKAGATIGGSKWAIVEHSKPMEQEAFEGLETAAESIKTAIAKL